MSDAPTPQLAPIANGATGWNATVSASERGRRPIIVRPAVSNEQVITYGTPTAVAASAAAFTSSGDDIVSIHATSAPPSRNPLICVLNDATAISWVSVPIGSNSSPVGPTEPATTT